MCNNSNTIQSIVNCPQNSPDGRTARSGGVAGWALVHDAEIKRQVLHVFSLTLDYLKAKCRITTVGMDAPDYNAFVSVCVLTIITRPIGIRYYTHLQILCLNRGNNDVSVVDQALICRTSQQHEMQSHSGPHSVRSPAASDRSDSPLSASFCEAVETVVSDKKQRERDRKRRARREQKVAI
jgi:hypothetical protein